ncbi:RNA polymerase sigma factor (plasmid) [Rhizobium grahamii]|uniref:RNA polymerase sigma factor n=1 Tax=Rhizobium grahamii TaxID=1120045 RepID=A0A5Q0CHL3_9HYPH|nr:MULTISPECIES: RNA polymerase sigma factor [Rhizobium]QFY63811.1 RNA polymerase sigma factor [Rhizobium grahamii]QRM52946.1 RNA polymerase sigma factor [Rhizobium sp. BG6]
MDAQLIEQARAGDRNAFARLIEANYDFIHAVAWRWCGNAADAEDISQDVCIKLGAAIRGFNGASRFRTWLYTLTLNAARDHRRKVFREASRITAFASEPIAAGASDDALSAEVWVAVRALPDKQCDAVLLIYGEGLTHSQAADIMGCSESTVSWHVHEARKRLRSVFGRQEV